jgi:CO/xanthine dehydrogenase FAD-binding subunit
MNRYGGLILFTIKKYVVVKNLEEAYLLNQKKNNVILGGILWLKMGDRKIHNAIDLSGLDLNQIEETDTAFHIGCMATLRDLELNKSLNSYFDGSITTAVCNIVGVQFRNSATIGGSIFGRYGFSDLLTCLLALDTYVELYKGGTIPLSEFVNMPYDNDILVRIIIQKDTRQVAYLTHRKTATDFSVIACAVAKIGEKWQVVLGARPSRAKLLRDDEKRLSEQPTDIEIEDFITYMKEQVTFGSNLRGSEEYRRHLAGVLIKRGIREIVNREAGNNED